MESLVTVVHIAVAVFMILVVLVQGGNSGGVGAAFGGGNTQGLFGASGANSFLGNLTYAAAAIFMATSVVLVILQGGQTPGLKSEIKSKAAEIQQKNQPLLEESKDNLKKDNNNK